MDIRDLTPWRSRSASLEHPLTSMHREMDRMFSRFFDSSDNAAFPGKEMQIHLDVSETETAFGIKVDLPGLEEKDIDVTYDDGLLTIKGERKSETENTDEKTRHRIIERSYGSFQRTLALPSNVDPEKVKATFSKGVLEITAPKRPESASQAKKIPVKSS